MTARCARQRRSLLALGLGLAAIAATGATGRAQCTTVWQPGHGIQGADGRVRAMTHWDPDGGGPLPQLVVAAGDFTAIDATAANGIAALDPTTGTWSALGSGCNGPIHALLALPNGELVAGGEFTTAGGVPARNIARWNGSTWSPLGAGLAMPFGVSIVRALAVKASGELVAVGRFDNAGPGVTVNSIAAWNGASWSPLGTGLSPLAGAIFDVATLPGGDLVAAGSFSSMGGVAAANLARWNGTAWAPLAGGSTNGGVAQVTVLASGDLVAIGAFGVAGTLLTPGIARWDGAAWHAFGSGVLGQNVLTLEPLAGGELLVGGWLPDHGNLAHWNGSTWTGVGGGLDSTVFSLLKLANGDVFAGGDFRFAGGTSALRIARWDGAAWNSVGDGTDGTVLDLVGLPDGSLVAVGAFTRIGGVAARGVARRIGTTWAPLGTGFGGLSPAGHACVVLPNGHLVVGGTFETAGGVPASCIARWDGATWSPLGSGMTSTPPSAPPRVTALAVMPNGELVVGGYFSAAGGVGASNIARWNGSVYAPLGTGTNIGVASLLVRPNGDLIVGGEFYAAGGVGAEGVARWNGSTWSPLGGGVTAVGSQRNVYALASDRNGDVIAAGVFVTAGGAPARNVARWTGMSWTAMLPPAGFFPAIYDLAVLPNGDVLAGGGMGIGGLQSLLRRWDGNTWSPFGPALNNPVLALEPRANGDIEVGGGFTLAGASVSAFTGRIVTTCPATAIASAAGCTGGGPVLTVTELPWLGGTFRAVASGIASAQLAVAVRGFATVAIPLPAILPQGVAGCSLLVAPDVLELSLPAAGTTSVQCTIPATPTLVGLVFHQQVIPLALDAQGGITAVTATNALTLTIGAF